MNIALIIAGGKGERMLQDIPKQFINVNDKPVIIYTLEAFQKHPDIDEIVVVCLHGWENILSAYAKQFNITKMTSIVESGVTGHNSIQNGVFSLRETHSEDDIVLVHDAIRPMINSDIISDSIAKCQLYGSGIAAIPCMEAILERTEDISSNNSIPRDRLLRTQTPQTFPLGKLLWAHDEANSRGIENPVASCTLLIELGEKVYFSTGSEKNLKLTTMDDLEIFKALLRSELKIRQL